MSGGGQSGGGGFGSGGGGGDLMSAGIDFYGADAAAAGSEMEMKFRGDQVEFNSKLRDIERKEIMDQSDRDIKKSGDEAKAILGKQKVSLAAQGIDIESGTAAAVQDETRNVALEEQKTIKNNAWNEAYNLKVESMQEKQQFRFDKMAAKRQAKTSLVTSGLKAGVAAAKTAAGGF